MTRSIFVDLLRQRRVEGRGWQSRDWHVGRDAGALCTQQPSRQRDCDDGLEISAQ